VSLNLALGFHSRARKRQRRGRAREQQRSPFLAAFEGGLVRHQQTDFATNLQLAPLAAGRQLDFEPEFGGSALLAASRNQARKMYHDEFPVSAGIGNAIGSAARTPSMARQNEMTNRAIFGARNVMAALLNARIYQRFRQYRAGFNKREPPRPERGAKVA
jgi:hypothetical protein